MRLFLTSSPCDDNVPEGVDLPCILNEMNQFTEQLRKTWIPDSRGLIITAFPDNPEANDEMCETFYHAFSYHGLSLSDMTVCDYRNIEDAASLIASSDMLILGGGHVPTQNAFFKEIGLREQIQNYSGIIVGISAGTMNCADIVYAQPEEPGESVDPDYVRYLSGLGLTDLNILPHYQKVKNYMLDGKRLYEDITYGDSMGHRFYVLIDGSYILIEGDTSTLYGEGYLITDGEIHKICDQEDTLAL